MGGLTQDLALGNFKFRSEGIETDRVGLIEYGLAPGAIAIDPFDYVNFLPGNFNQIAQEGLFVIKEVHGAISWLG